MPRAGTAACEYESKLLKAYCASYAIGLAPLLCAGVAENANQPETFVEPKVHWTICLPFAMPALCSIIGLFLSVLQTQVQKKGSNCVPVFVTLFRRIATVPCEACSYWCRIHRYIKTP